MDVELRHLRVLVIVGLHGSVEAAATSLMMPVPALQRSLEQLESALGVSLVGWGQRPGMLTGEGQALFAAVRSAVDRIDRVLQGSPALSDARESRT